MIKNIFSKNIKYNITSVLLIIFFLITNNYYNINESIKYGFMDSKSYLNIYLIITNHLKNVEIPYYHLERWPIHYLIGIIKAKCIKINIYYIYLLFNFLIVISIRNLIGKLKCNEISKIGVLSFILFNPYLLRMYICNPVAICDLIFVYSIILFIIGIEIKKEYYILFAIIISSIARQTSLLFIPILTIVHIYKKINFKQLIITISIIIFWKLINQNYLNSYYINDTNYLQIIINGWKLNNKSLSLYFDFFIRLIIFLSSISPILLFKIENKNIIYINILPFIICILQPILFGPNITGNNIERLSALGIGFLIPIIINNQQKVMNIYIFILFNIILSFHHHFSILNYSSIGKYVFGIIIIMIPISILAIKKINYILQYNKLP